MDLRKRYKVMVGDPRRIWIHLVGCGGTGSFLALHLARMAYDARRDGIGVELTLYDGDQVEARNVGRQNFVPGEVGENKALALARRYSCAFGLEIEARPEMFRSGLAPICGRGDLIVLVGAVDAPAARDEIRKAVVSRGLWWLDAGNHEHAGQVLLGNREDLEAPAISPLGWCEGLPLPSVVSPELVTVEGPPESVAVDPSCAELLALGAQSLMINQAMAGWAAAMLARLLLSRDLDYWQTWVDLASGVARSVGIVGDGGLNGTQQG